MTRGTRSLLYGSHAFWLHPWIVALAWIKLFGFPFDPRIWAAFWLHDIGYWGKPNLDGPEGKLHPETGGWIMHRLFDRPGEANATFWRDFTILHSRCYAKALGQPVSRLCVADKLAFCLTPRWLYLPMARATGELAEYLAAAQAKDARAWHRELCAYLRAWVRAH